MQYAGVDNKMMGIFGGKGAGGRGGASYEEEARRKREDARRQLFSGVAMIGDEEAELEVLEGQRFFAALLAKLRKWIERSIPLQVRFMCLCWRPRCVW